MTNTATEALSVVVEREIPYPPEKIWRALTQPHLIEEWLMKNDFKPVVGHRFDLRADWGVVDCQVLAVEPNKTLSYTWAAYGLESVVTWTLTPTSTGTHLRMEQSGFRPDQPQYYQGAKGGWQRFFAALEQILARTAAQAPETPGCQPGTRRAASTEYRTGFPRPSPTPPSAPYKRAALPLRTTNAPMCRDDFCASGNSFQLFPASWAGAGRTARARSRRRPRSASARAARSPDPGDRSG